MYPGAKRRVFDRKEGSYIDAELGGNPRGAGHNFARHLDLFTHVNETGAKLDPTFSIFFGDEVREKSQFAD